MKPSDSLSRHASGIFYLWYIDDNSRRRKVSTRCRQKSDAKAWVMKFLRGQVQAKPNRRNLSITDFKNEYLRHSRRHHKPKTYKNCKTCFNLMFPLVRKKQLTTMDESYLGRCFRRWVRNAGLNPQPRFHDRLSFASNLAISGVSMFSLGKMLGHADTRTTEIYAHLAPSNVQGISDALNHPNIAMRITGPGQTRQNAKRPKKGNTKRSSIAKLTALVEELLEKERSRTSG